MRLHRCEVRELLDSVDPTGMRLADAALPRATIRLQPSSSLPRAPVRVPDTILPAAPPAAHAVRGGYRAYHAPAGHGEALIAPPAAHWDELLAANLAATDLQSARPGGSFWQTLRHDARSQLIRDARRYTSAYRDIPPARDRDAELPIWMAGHQPTLFHPGVWFKNRMLAAASESTGSLAINLVIDNDVASGASIRVPVGGDAKTRTRSVAVAMDAPAGGVPFEQWEITDRDHFASFDRRLADTIGPAVADPAVWQLWPHAREALRRCGVAGCALATARHRLEADLGWQTLECPLGVAVRGWPFARFTAEILCGLSRFVDVYNAAADRYRVAHGIRSAAHPVPDLRRQGDWTEVPLWIYGNEDPVRQPLWARPVAGGLELSDQIARRIFLDGADPVRWAEQLVDAADPHHKIRPRALVTTMYARTVLSDGFIHGIGGGKYDQVTDEIIADFFGVAPPAIAVVSATVRLPGHREEKDFASQIARIKRDLRDTRFSGERFLDADDPLAIIKSETLRSRPVTGSAAAWHRAMVSINDEISAKLDSRRTKLRAELARVKTAAANHSIWASREHSFVLHPLSDLQGVYQSMAPTHRN